MHVLDLAKGHLIALDHLREHHPGVRAWNLGTGKGSTVFHMIKAFSKACGKDCTFLQSTKRNASFSSLLRLLTPCPSSATS